MNTMYFTVNRTDKWKGLPYQTKVSGHDDLHYNAESVLTWLAELIVNEHKQDLVVFRNNLPNEDKTLSENLEVMVNGHNMALRLNRSRSGLEAYKVLNKVGRYNS